MAAFEGIQQVLCYAPSLMTMFFNNAALERQQPALSQENARLMRKLADDFKLRKTWPKSICPRSC